jgi:hypothetical protein
MLVIRVSEQCRNRIVIKTFEKLRSSGQSRGSCDSSLNADRSKRLA